MSEKYYGFSHKNALLVHMEHPPAKCRYCLFKTVYNKYSPAGLILCYFETLPVSEQKKGCPPEFFLRRLVEVL